MATERFINELKNRANANRLGRFGLQVYDRFEKEFKGDTQQDGTPTPDNPIEIENVTGLQNINVCGKNLLDTNKMIKFTPELASRWYWIDGIYATNPSTLFYKVEQGKTYTISIKEKANFSKIQGIYKINGVESQAFIIQGTNTTATFTPNTTTNLYIRGNTESANVETYCICQLEVGSTATEFEEYKGNTYEINLGKNLFNTLNRNTLWRATEVSKTNNELVLKPVQNAGGYVQYQVNNIKPDTTYTISCNMVLEGITSGFKGTIYVYEYNASGTQHSITSLNNENLKRTFTTQSDTTHLRFSFYALTSSDDNWENIRVTYSNIQLELGDTQTDFSEYFEPIELNKINTYQDSIKKSTGKNLFDKSTITTGQYIDASGNLVNDNSNFVGDYIPIDNTKSYYASQNAGGVIRVGYYDSNKTFISRQLISANYGSLTIPNNAVYVRLSCYNQSLDTLQLEIGNRQTSYEPYLPKGTWYLEKQTRRLELAIADMNNSDNYPGWKNLVQLYQDYPNQNASFITKTDVISNINGTLFTFGINTLYGNGTLWIYKSVFNYTQAEWKTNYPNLIVSIVYGLQTPEYTEITNEELINQLESIELLEGTNNITITSEDLPVIFEYSFWNGDVEVDEDERFLDINQSNYLSKIELKDSCYVNDTIIGSIYTQSAEVELLDLPVDTKLVSKKITPQIGVRYSDNSTEYETFDNYTIESINDEQTASNTKFTAMNGGTLLDKEYVCSLSFENGQTHTINEFYQDACSQIGLTPTDETFDNSEIVMTGNPFQNKETIRTVLSEVEKTSCSIAEFDWENKTISLTWLSNQIDYEFNTSDYSILEGSSTQYGPLNVIIVGNSQLDGENVTITDEESVAQNGEHQIIIDSPYFLYTEALRTQAIEAIYNKLDGLKYYDLKLTTPYGKPFLKVGNKIRINTNENQVYDTYVLTHTLTYDGAIQSIIESPALTQEEQTIKNEFKGNSVKERLKRTEVTVDKAAGQITALTQTVSDVQTDLNDNYYTLEQTNQLVQTAASGITNTFSEAGGNNVFRNTGLWFEEKTDRDLIYPSSSLFPSGELFTGKQPLYEYWTGDVHKLKEERAANQTALLLLNGLLEQDQTVPNGIYTVSFIYEKLIDLATVKCIINDVEYELTEDEATEFTQTIEVKSQTIKVKFECDADEACEIYDLMVNAGSVKLAYSQNQNETTTDTVNISKGITITSSDTDTTFKANSDGVRIYDSKDLVNPKTKFTDKGMETDYLKVKNEADIVDILIQRVGSHTWLTKI